MNLKNSKLIILIISIFFAFGNISHAANSIPSCTSPTISSINPSSLNTGVSTPITVYGSNFTNQTYVSFNGTAKTTNISGSNQLTFSLTTLDTSIPGYKTIKLSNGISCTSNQAILTIGPSNNNLQQPTYNNNGWWQPSRYVSVITYVANNITKDSAILSGGIDPSNYSATVYFEYGTSPDLLEFTNTNQKFFNSVNELSDFSDNIKNLLPSTTYYFRAVGKNSTNTSNGKILSFTTLNEDGTKALKNNEVISKKEEPKTDLKKAITDIPKKEDFSVSRKTIIYGVIILALIFVLAYIIAKRKAKQRTWHKKA